MKENVDEEENESNEESMNESEIGDNVDSLASSKSSDFEEKDQTDPQKKMHAVRSSFAAIYSPKFSKASRDEGNRASNKKNTKISYKESALNSDMIHYPIGNFKPIPIILSEQKELIYIYMSEPESEYFLNKINLHNAYAIKEKHIRDSLKDYLPLYYRKLFLNTNLEKRLNISMSPKMKHIKPIYTIAIEMDEKLKNTDIVKMQSTKYLLVKKDIFKHIDVNEKGLAKFDPFSKIKIKENKNANDIQNDPLPKWAHSLNKNLNDEDSDSEDDIDNDNEFKFSRKYSRKISINSENIKDYMENLDDEIEEENKNDEENNSDNNKIEELEVPYRRYLKNLFYPKLEDFRKSLVKKILKNKEISKTIDLEKFICLLEFFIGLFTGIQVKYSIDELGFLNMDLYANELIYMNMAEILHYQVQFQIRDISHINHRNKNELTQKLFINLNKCQYEDFQRDKIEYFPPSTAFIQELSNHFRRYSHNDNFHLCLECEKIFSQNKYVEVSCDSSVFRFIDKVRLLTKILSGVIDINYLEKMIENNSKEDNEENNIFKTTMILRNEDVFKEFDIIYIIRTYLSPIITKQILKLNNTFRNIFGEIIGYYYTWVSHYISWVIFPALLGLITEILILCIKDDIIQNYIYLGFLIFILLWGFYYVRHWKKYEKFCNHIWGMDSFQAEITNLYDENYSKVSYVTFLGIKIPKVDKVSALLVNIISVVLVLISSLFIMGVNVGIFKINKVDNFLFKYLNKIFSYIGISNEITKYTLPILIYIAREIISKIFYEISAILAKLEKPTDKEEYDQIVIKKRLTLEFVNYYFNLYYIMLYKKMKNKCENDDCFQELRKQLILILLSNICSVIFQFIYKIIYMRKNIKNFEIKMKQAYEKNSDIIDKLKFYTRELFTEDNIQQLIIPIIFNFGYVIQFGICCPISFFFMLILIIFIRLTNAISMIYVYYVKTLSISKGLLVYNNTQYLLVFAGMFSNLCLLFYTKNSSHELNILYKLIIIVLIQNGIVIICNIIRFKSLPFWFRYRKIVKLKYLKKFGVIQNKNNTNRSNLTKRLSIFKFYDKKGPLSQLSSSYIAN